MSEKALTLEILTPSDKHWIAQLVVHEAVVPIRHDGDLERRFAPDRLTYVALLQDELVGFIHIALAQTYPDSLEDILSGPIYTGVPRVGIFYGITRTSEQMRGRAKEILSLASEALLQRWPHLALSTYSPMPTFRSWLERVYTQHIGNNTEHLEDIARRCAAGVASPEMCMGMRQMAYLYLHTEEKPGRLLDPVARFHLGNGAQIRDILVGADGSWHGLEQSLGVMVSYQYHPHCDGLTLSHPPILEESLHTLDTMKRVA
ncbi:MAG TPA: hypothetical protein DCE42_11990 [Myxococcales bacterium]|nr:hypothetical protein [Deltaproteobacteria bacterium]HAA55471.1 hypothetical protein [Myxococcales bacterium]|tara:strand:+ start:19657 stop:20436 length:780 start_codon:yes stop_codon:yes gene_type:complete